MKNQHAVGRGGGEGIRSKHTIGPHGFRAIIIDSEGNRIAVNSPSA